MTRSAARLAESLPDVVAADDEILAVVGAAAHQDMDVRIVGVPVIDGDPVELRAEIALGVRHQLAREGPKIGHLGRVLGGDGEPEVMPVVLAALGERLGVGVVGRGRRTSCASAPSRVTPSRLR